MLGWQQWENDGTAIVEFVVSHHPGRAETTLPPGHDAPSEQMRHSLFHP